MSASSPSDHGDFPPDPLLSSGSFISSNISTDAGNLDHGVKRQPIPPRSGMSSGADPPKNTAQPAVESKTRKRAAPGDNNWLPPGWRVEDRVRTSGATAGSVDKYYHEPGTGRKFRSKTEVMYYLEKGAPKKSAKKSEISDAQSDHSKGQGISNRSAKKAKETPFSFDFHNPPEKVSWVLTNDSEEEYSWTPFTASDEKVPESIARDWTTAFSMATTRNGQKS
ncbi:PREDICTED: methyl-CpG-binding domain-containing protein 5-like isoform X2 [Tarenaya hassleriana]|uniref:methyl-CpG-binding domain-containing protein 5-like isoform X2 n=1 Tax=Tarenaya hassleriana TaxID=28532 RepID=UPI00053C1B46|nr:PREDICTED: methyl-CpG-binding domain-containing protein 5-like isoform X2 [Tarenaya hassleriana]